MAAQRRQISAELERLLPTVLSVPSEVVSLAESVLSQTAGTFLKPDEAPARVHACCQVAVERLAARLALPPPVVAQAPVPPRKYALVLERIRRAADEAVGRASPAARRTAAVASNSAAAAPSGTIPDVDQLVRVARRAVTTAQPPSRASVLASANAILALPSGTDAGKPTTAAAAAAAVGTAMVHLLRRRNEATGRVPRGAAAALQRALHLSKPALDAAVATAGAGEAVADIIAKLAAGGVDVYGDGDGDESDADADADADIGENARGEQDAQTKASSGTTARTARTRAVKTTMKGSCIDFRSARRRAELDSWKQRTLARIQARRIKLAQSAATTTATVAGSASSVAANASAAEDRDTIMEDDVAEIAAAVVDETIAALSSTQTHLNGG